MLNKISNALFKNSVLSMISALVIVGMISGYALVYVYKYATPKIEENIEKETKKAISSIFPGTVTIEDDKDMFKAIDAKGEVLGYAFLAEGNGYQGTIKLIAGADKEMKKLSGFEVLESQETPGLGAEIGNKAFKEQFRGLPLGKNIEYVKNRKPTKDNQIEAITGATISSRAVVNILNKKIRK
ncbi:MAG: RnfABCDGE type electron transport complex subunit G [Candidatus Aadella gelida]|nr:RnfABCDGE type electron transport complex subunit G [Candidatus Aadella gelida]